MQKFSLTACISETNKPFSWGFLLSITLKMVNIILCKKLKMLNAQLQEEFFKKKSGEGVGAHTQSGALSLQK